MNVLLTGGGFSNKGAESMLFAARDEMARRLGGLTAYAAVRAPERPMAEEAGLIPLAPRDEFLQNALTKLNRRLFKKKLTAALEKRAARRLLAGITRLDAIVDIAGFAYGDAWGEAPVRKSLALMQTRPAEGCSTVFMPQAWGPFRQPEVAHYAREMCSRAAAVYARDELSMVYLAELGEGVRAKAALASDIAFRFKAAPPEEGAAVLGKLGLEPGRRPLVGIVPNVGVPKHLADAKAKDEYVQLLADICVDCASKLGCGVVLFPHTRPDNSGCLSDLQLCEGIKGLVPSGLPVEIMGACLAAAVLKSLIGHLDMLVSSRFHALVAALSCRVPPVALGWSHKYPELLRQFGLEEFAVNLVESGMEDVRRLAPRAWEKRDASRALIGGRLPAIQAEVDGIFDRLAALLKDRSR